MVSVGWADPHLREGRKFLRHLIQQRPHLQQKHLSHSSGLKRKHVDEYGGFSLSLQAPAHLSVAVLKVAQLETLLQFGMMPHPELIKSSLCLIQLRQQPGKGEEEGMETTRDF